MMTFLFGFIVVVLYAVVCLAIWGALAVSGKADDRAVLELRRVE